MTRILLILFAILLIVLLGRLWIGSGSYPHIMKLEQQITTLSDANQQQLEKNRKLEAEVQELQSGTEAIEARARNDFGMIKKGETFYQVILKSDSAKSPQNKAEVSNDAVDTKPPADKAADIQQK